MINKNAKILLLVLSVLIYNCVDFALSFCKDNYVNLNKINKGKTVENYSQQVGRVVGAEGPQGQRGPAGPAGPSSVGEISPLVTSIQFFNSNDKFVLNDDTKQYYFAVSASRFSEIRLSKLQIFVAEAPSVNIPFEFGFFVQNSSEIRKVMQYQGDTIGKTFRSGQDGVISYTFPTLVIQPFNNKRVLYLGIKLKNLNGNTIRLICNDVTTKTKPSSWIYSKSGEPYVSSAGLDIQPGAPTESDAINLLPNIWLF